MSTNLQEKQCRLDRDNTTVETIDVVKNQQTAIGEQRKKIDELSDVSIHSFSTTHDLS